MLDLLLLLGLLIALVLGYRRGFLTSALDLAVLLAALWVAYRTGPVAVTRIGSWTGADPLEAGVIASVVLFLVLLVVGTLLRRRMEKAPVGLRALDGAAGAIASGAWFTVAALAVLVVAAAVPSVPDQVEGLVRNSRVAKRVLSEDSTVLPAVSRLLGDRTIESFVHINRLSGRSRVMLEGEELVVIPAVHPAELVERPGLARDLFLSINRARIEEGVGTVAWSAPLAEVAGGQGREMYEQGYFSHESPVTGFVDERLYAAGIPFRSVGENLALAPTLDSIHVGLMASESHRATILDARFNRVGVTILEGPLGLMAVQVFSG